MSGDRKYGRNEKSPSMKRYKAVNQEAKNKRRKHTTLSAFLEKKRAKMQARGMDVSGITKAIQHHESMADSA